jgi:hypothetical protein
VRGFEPLASAVRGQRSTGLSYTPRTARVTKGSVVPVGSGVTLEATCVLVERALDALLHGRDREVTAGLLDQ